MCFCFSYTDIAPTDSRGHKRKATQKHFEIRLSYFQFSEYVFVLYKIVHAVPPHCETSKNKWPPPLSSLLLAWTVQVL